MLSHLAHIWPFPVQGTLKRRGLTADSEKALSSSVSSYMLYADCDRIAIENPVGIISGDYIPKHFLDLAEKYGLPLKPTQIIHPWMFGDNYSKSTCFWLKGLEPLVPKVTEQPELKWFEYTNRKTGKKKRQPKWYADALKLPPRATGKAQKQNLPRHCTGYG